MVSSVIRALRSIRGFPSDSAASAPSAGDPRTLLRRVKGGWAWEMFDGSHAGTESGSFTALRDRTPGRFAFSNQGEE